MCCSLLFFVGVIESPSCFSNSNDIVETLLPRVFRFWFEGLELASSFFLQLCTFQDASNSAWKYAPRENSLNFSVILVCRSKKKWETRETRNSANVRHAVRKANCKIASVRFQCKELQQYCEFISGTRLCPSALVRPSSRMPAHLSGTVNSYKITSLSL